MGTEDETVNQSEPQLLHKQSLTLGVWGLAVLDKFVYVALEKSEIILRYKLDDAGKLANVDQADNLFIKDVVSGKVLSRAADMVVDTRLKRLYISDRKYGATEWPLFTIQFGALNDPSLPPQPLYIRSILLDATPGGLSMSRDESELLVVCEHMNDKSKRSVRFFSGVEANKEGDGSSSPLKEVGTRILLEPITDKFVAQARQVADNRIVISKSKIGEKEYRLYVIDNTGKLIHEYGKEQMPPQSLIEPYSVLVDGDGFVLVNDCNNERVMVLQLVKAQHGELVNNDEYKECLEYRRDLISKDHCIEAGIYHPRRICAVNGRPDLLLVACGTKGPPKTPTPGGRKVDPGSVSVWRVCL